MKKYLKRTSLSEDDTLAAVRHLNRRRVPVTLERLEEYLSIGIAAIRKRLDNLRGQGKISHVENSNSGWYAKPIKYKEQKIKKAVSRKRSQPLVTFAEDYGYEGATK